MINQNLQFTSAFPYADNLQFTLAFPYVDWIKTQAIYPRQQTSTISRANTVKLWLRAFEANSPLGRLLHCLLSSSSIALRSTPSPAITRTTWLSGPCSAYILLTEMLDTDNCQRELSNSLIACNTREQEKASFTKIVVQRWRIILRDFPPLVISYYQRNCFLSKNI